MKEYKIALISISCALIGILPIIYLSDVENETSFFSTNTYFIFLIILVVIFLVIALFGSYLASFFNKQKKNYKDFVYDKYKLSLEYLDLEGKNASLNISINIDKLNMFSRKESTTNDVKTDGFGKIHPETGIGIHTKLTTHKSNKLSYSTKFSKNNIIKNRHFTSFACRFEDTFNQEGSNFYQIGPKYFCRSYEFVLIYPESATDIVLKFKSGEKCDDGTCKNWTIDDETTYSTYSRFGRKVAKVLYHNIPNTEVRSISWEFN